MKTALLCLKNIFATSRKHARALSTMGDANTTLHSIVVASRCCACFLFVAMSHSKTPLLGHVLAVLITALLVYHGGRDDSILSAIQAK